MTESGHFRVSVRRHVEPKLIELAEKVRRSRGQVVEILIERATLADIVVPIIAVVWWTDVNLLPVIQRVVVAKVITLVLCAGGASLVAT